MIAWRPMLKRATLYYIYRWWGSVLCICRAIRDSSVLGRLKLKALKVGLFPEPQHNNRYDRYRWLGFLSTRCYSDGSAERNKRTQVHVSLSSESTHGTCVTARQVCLPAIICYVARRQQDSITRNHRGSPEEVLQCGREHKATGNAFVRLDWARISVWHW